MFGKTMHEIAGEPPIARLADDPDVLEAYRISESMGWQRPYIIRAERRRNPEIDRPYLKSDPSRIPAAEAYFITIHRAGDPVTSKDRLPQTTRAALTDDQWHTLHLLIEASRFWELPDENVRGGGMDAPLLRMEGFREGRTHDVTRWSLLPDFHGDLFSIPFSYLRDLAALATRESR